MRRENGRSFFYQWELEQKLIVEENCTEVHYYNGSRKNATVCEAKEVNGIRVADVPNDLLQVAADLHAYAWNSFEGSVVGYRIFGVQPKARPDDYVYTPTQVKSYDSLVEQFEKHGTYYMPLVSEDGDLQWVPSVNSIPAIPGGNIRGPKGDPGCISKVLQVAGNSQDDTMSQKAVTDELYEFVPIEFESGGLQSANGELSANEYRARSCFINIKSITLVSSVDTDYSIYVYSYDSSITFLGTNGGWVNQMLISDVVAMYPATAYIQVLVKKGSAAITPEEVYGKIVSLRSKFVTGSLPVAHPHAQYFQVTSKGVLSLKPEFRGVPAKITYPDALSDKYDALGLGFAGSRNSELPENLVIPDMIDNVAVRSIAKGAFYGNKAIKSVTIPVAIKGIPEYCFRESSVENVYNTAQVTSVGMCAFQESNIKQVEFPKLITMAAQAFCQCSYLIYVDIGEVEEIANDVFFRCPALSTIASANKIKKVGRTSLQGTRSLANASFVNNLTSFGTEASIGTGAFINSALPFDWSKLTNCTFGYNATPLQIHADIRYQKSTENDAPSGDAWTGYDAYFNEAWEGYMAKRKSEGKTVDCENPLPTLFCQADPRWYERPIGNTVFEYGGQGCSIFSLLHAYCGFHRLPLTTVVDFENVAEKLSPGILDKFSDNYSVIEGNEEKGTRVVADGIGLEYIPGASFIYSEDADGNKTYRNGLREVFDALGEGHYVVVNGYNGSSAGHITGHAILLYGLTKDGQFKVASSGIRYYDDKTNGSKYIMPYKAMLEPENPTSGANSFYVVRMKKEA